MLAVPQCTCIMQSKRCKFRHAAKQEANSGMHSGSPNIARFAELPFQAPKTTTPKVVASALHMNRDVDAPSISHVHRDLRRRALCTGNRQSTLEVDVLASTRDGGLITRGSHRRRRRRTSWHSSSALHRHRHRAFTVVPDCAHLVYCIGQHLGHLPDVVFVAGLLRLDQVQRCQ